MGLSSNINSLNSLSNLERNGYSFSMGSDVFNRTSNPRLLLIMNDIPSNGGTCYDHSSNGYDGIYGSAMASNDRVNEALVYVTNFGGTSNNYINFGDRDDFTFGNGTIDEEFTIGAIVKIPSVIIADEQIICKTHEWELFVDSSKRINFRLYDNDSNNFINVFSSVLTGSTKYFVCGTYDGAGVLSLFINGITDQSYSSLGTYVSMHNKVSNLVVGGNSFYNESFTNDLGCIFLDQTQWSSADVWSLWLEFRGKYEI